jgi:hypothetical protein
VRVRIDQWDIGQRRSEVGDQGVSRHRAPSWKAGRVRITSDTSYNARQELQIRHLLSKMPRPMI